MPKRYKHLNSRGSSLIMVVIGAAFLGILGALILSITYTNIELKTANNKSKKNFYTEEVAVNEVTAKLEEYSAQSMSAAHSWLVKNYQKESKDVSKRFDEYRKRYMITLSQILHGTPDENTEVADEYSITVLQNGIRSFSMDPTDDSYVNVSVYSKGAPVTSGVIVHSVDKDGNKNYESLTIKDLSITYKDKEGYETNIVTDITMDFPTPGGVDTSFAKFALISDTFIDCTSAVQVTGGVYAGNKLKDSEDGGVGDAVNPAIGGVQVSSLTGNLTIDGGGNLVATRGNISAVEYGRISISNAKVWAKNIRTLGMGDPVKLTPSINIDAITKVQDDLVMKAPNSTINLSKSYYGFSYKNKSLISGKTTSDTSSAITVNAKNANLNLAGLDRLVLFGRAFVSSSDTDETGKEANSMMDIMTGQSIAVKSDQGAYLVPKESYLKIPCNPIDQDSIQAYAVKKCSHRPGYDPVAPHLSLSMKDDIVDFTKGKAAVIHKYLDPDMPIRAIYYVQGAGDAHMVNYYWNFKNEEKANEYFEWYYNINKGEMQDKYKEYYRKDGSRYSFGFKKNWTRLTLAGDVLYQDDSTGNFYLEKGNAGDMASESAQLTAAYKSVALNLREDGDSTRSLDANPYVDKHFNLGEVKKGEQSITGTGIKSTRNHKDASIYISNQPEFHVTNNMTGLIIASGNVVVNTTEFEGLIVADGKIELSTNTALYADEKMILDLLKYCQENGNLLKDYIYGYNNSSNGSAGDDSVDYAKAISFENWRKNA